MASYRKEFFSCRSQIRGDAAAKICSLGAECLAEPWESPRIPWLVDVHARVDVCVSSSLGFHSRVFSTSPFNAASDHTTRQPRPHAAPVFSVNVCNPRERFMTNITPTRTTPPHTQHWGFLALSSALQFCTAGHHSIYPCC